MANVVCSHLAVTTAPRERAVEPARDAAPSPEVTPTGKLLGKRRGALGNGFSAFSRGLPEGHAQPRALSPERVHRRVPLGAKQHEVQLFVVRHGSLSSTAASTRRHAHSKFCCICQPCAPLRQRQRRLPEPNCVCCTAFGAAACALVNNNCRNREMACVEGHPGEAYSDADLDAALRQVEYHNQLVSRLADDLARALLRQRGRSCPVPAPPSTRIPRWSRSSRSAVNALRRAGSAIPQRRGSPRAASSTEVTRLAAFNAQLQRQLRVSEARAQRLACDAAAGDNVRGDLKHARLQLGELLRQDAHRGSENAALKRQVALMTRQIDSGMVRATDGRNRWWLWG